MQDVSGARKFSIKLEKPENRLRGCCPGKKNAFFAIFWSLHDVFPAFFHFNLRIFGF